MAVLPVGISGEEAGYQIERSLRFNSADSAYLNRTPASAGNRQVFTQSIWFKRGKLATNQFLGVTVGGSASYGLYFDTNDILNVYVYYTGSVWQGQLITTQVFRDPSAWYHFVLSVDTTQATSTNRIKLYVNGLQITAFSTANYPNQNQNTDFNNTIVHEIGRRSTSNYTDGYCAEINWIDGSALTPTSFGEFNSDTGVWQPKAYTGSYGTQGWFLDFSDNSGTTSTTLGKDSSGNGNNWTPNLFSVTAGKDNDSLVDSPTRYGTDTGAGGEVRGNYCTLNPLANSGVLSNGNLDFAGSGAAYKNAYATITIPSSVKTYIEVTLTNKQANGNNAYCGIDSVYDLSGDAQAVGFYGLDAVYTNGNLWTSINNTITDTSIATANNDVFMFAIDQASQKFWIGRNGTWLSSGNPATGANSLATISATDLYYFRVGAYNANNWTVNFGQRPFAYTAPSGFLSLCTTNLPEPTIADGGEYFNAVLYTGNNSNGNAVTGVGFAPDFIWFKSRSAANGHCLVNRITGVSAGLGSDSTAAEQNPNLASFDSDGFTVNSVVDFSSTNASGNSIVAWNWKANGSGVSNTAGSISSTVSVNTTSGFSIVTYTGNGGSTATIGHGLGTAPNFIVIKNRDSTDGWAVYHSSLGATRYLDFTTSTPTTSTSTWNNTSPTSSVFTINTNSRVNGSSTKHVAYCFAPVAGYSAFGSYTGNGSADGPFVYTGFRPAFVMIKGSSDSDRAWVMLDVKRNTFNVMNLNLYANASDAEATDARADALSNGFKLRGTGTWVNNNSSTYIYAAFAENPFAYSLAR